MPPKFEPKQQLEYFIFLYVTCLGTFICSLLLINDIFIRQDYLSAFINIIVVVVFLVLYFLARFKSNFNLLIEPLVAILIVGVNISWFTSNGSSPVNMVIFSTGSIAAISILNGRIKYIFVIIISLNLMGLMILEYFFSDDLFLDPYFNNRPDSLGSNIGAFVTILGGNIIISYLKDGYEKQFLKLIEAKRELEISNESLMAKNERILVQQDQIEINNERLNSQSLQLKDALKELALLNSQLEKRVDERTLEINELNKELDLLFYRSSHDIRGPLMTFRGLINLGIMSEKDVENIWVWDKLGKTIDKLEHITNKFTMISKINHFDHKLPSITIIEAVENLLQKYNYFLIDFEIHTSIIATSLPQNDARIFLIHMIMDNLLENAIHFQRKMVKSEIRMVIVEEESFLKIDVYDNGWGIPKHFIPQVTEMYFRANENSKGNGLGLYVVSSAVKKLNGKIIIESVLGHFTRVIIQIPI